MPGLHCNARVRPSVQWGPTTFSYSSLLRVRTNLNRVRRMRSCEAMGSFEWGKPIGAAAYSSLARRKAPFVWPFRRSLRVD